MEHRGDLAFPSVKGRVRAKWSAHLAPKRHGKRACFHDSNEERKKQKAREDKRIAVMNNDLLSDIRNKSV
eukprot:11898119-Ditylum_brightwellii.AAC.1